MQWVMTDVSYASWAFLYASQPVERQAYPLKIVQGHMYRSATIEPVPSVHIATSAITDSIDNFKQDDLRPLDHVNMQPLVLFHVNVKTLLKHVKRECYRRQLTDDRVFMATFPEARPRVTEV